ncbi:hypothetical protein R3P38DRAFT_2542022 [Favolaschia claudopus]|uniref:Uncharacterized protein n=1 Tax=Favolaschia claudopus TaxID=2862362 RepID=A0AAW0AUB5_9AGAR
MPIWKHPGLRKSQYDQVARRHAIDCLRSNHKIRTVEDTMVIASRRTIVAQKPHTVNNSGIARQNCGCVSCRRDRDELGCKNPGKCIDTAQALIN